MTAEECLNAINRMFKVEANSQYEKGELKVSYKDNVQVIDKSVKYMIIKNLMLYRQRVLIQMAAKGQRLSFATKK